MQEQQPAPMPLSLQALEVLNESPDFAYALTYNTRNNKYVMLRLDRVRGITQLLDEGVTQPATYRVMAFSAGNTPTDAARDALKLRLAPERTVESSY